MMKELKHILKAIEAIDSSGLVMESGTIIYKGEDWTYKFKKVKTKKRRI